MLAADVAQLMQDFGSDLTLTRPVTGAYDPATGSLPASASQAYTIRGVFINYEDRTVDGSVIRYGDRKLLVQAQEADTVPVIGDLVDGLKVIDVRTIAPNGIPIAFTCQMRK